MKTTKQPSKGTTQIQSTLKPDSEQTKSEKVTEHTYHMNRVNKTKLLLAFMTLYLTFDYISRDYLFWLSVKHAQILRTDYLNIYADKFFQYISEVGDKYVVGLMIFCSYHLLDHPKAFIMTLAAFTALSFSCILKSLNHEPRPFFVADLKPNKCRFEFGNPSGHSFIATGLFITFWDLYCRQYKLSPKMTKLTFLPILLLIPILGFSRIYNGVHTYNQVIGGFTWGFLTYYTLCHVFYYEICVFVSRLHHKVLKALIWNSLTQIFVVAYIVAVSLFFFNQKIHPTPIEWIEAIQRNCLQTEGLLIDAEVSNFIQYNLIWGLLGAYVGLIIDQKYLPTKDYPYFFKTSLTISIKRILVCSILGLITQSPMILISKKSSFWVVMIFRTIIPSFLCNVYIFGFSKYLAFRCGLINTKLLAKQEISKETILQEEFPDKSKYT